MEEYILNKFDVSVSIGKDDLTYSFGNGNQFLVKNFRPYSREKLKIIIIDHFIEYEMVPIIDGLNEI